MSNDLPLLAITMGDPAGIGPEVVLKALRHAEVFDRCRPLVLGDRRILERAASPNSARGAWSLHPCARRTCFFRSMASCGARRRVNPLSYP